MKVAFGSDFHFEFYSNEKMREIISSWSFYHDTEVIIIAGDLHVGAERVLECLNTIWMSYGIPIVYVPGNHEYYNSSFLAENEIFTEYKHENKFIHILLQDHVMIDRVMFTGCMGNLDGSYKQIDIGVHGALNDFHLISDFNTRISRGKYERHCLENSLFNADYDNAVVVTHTMPSPKCISEPYKGSYLNGAFANDWEREIVDYKPKYWVCGHTHDVGDCKIDETDILINPMGYPRESKNWEWRYLNV